MSVRPYSEFKVYYVEEEDLAVTPDDPAFLTPGISVDNVEVSHNPNRIFLRGLGSRDIGTIKRGKWDAEIKFRYVPVDTIFLDYAITNIAETMNVLLKAESIASSVGNNVKGAKLNTVKLNVPHDNFFTIDVSLIGLANVSEIPADGASYNDASGTPLLGQDVVIGGTSPYEITDFEVEIKNNVKLGYVIKSGGTAYLAQYNTAGKREITGNLSKYFYDDTDLLEVVNDAEFDITLDFFTKTLTLTDCQWDKFILPVKLDDVPVIMKLPFTAKSCTLV